MAAAIAAAAIMAADLGLRIIRLRLPITQLRRRIIRPRPRIIQRRLQHIIRLPITRLLTIRCLSRAASRRPARTRARR